MEQTFDYTKAIKAVIRDLVRYVPELEHVRPGSILVSFAKARQRTHHGTYAKVVPLRFEGGRFYERRGGEIRSTPRWTFRDREYLYILYVYMPRFHDACFREKLETLVHELWHISPACDGDLRRFEGRTHYHGDSCRDFDDEIRPLVDAYLKVRGDAACLEFLRVSTERLERQYGRLVGLKVQHPTMTITRR